MAEIFRFLTLAEPYLFFLLGIVGFLYFRKLILAIGDYKNSLFGLEKDNARGHIFQAGGVMVLVLIIAVGEFIFVSYIGTNPAVFNLNATPTLNLSSTETPIFSGEIPAGVMSTDDMLAITEAPLGEPKCISGQLDWSFPLEGDELKGKVELKGTTNVPDFGFYKYEYSIDNVNWNTLLAGTTVVTDGVLGEWDTSLLTPGDYFLRLVVTTTQGSPLPACIIKIRILPN